VENWVCYYGEDRGVFDVDDVDLLVVDGDSMGLLRDAEKRGRIVLAYISVGEAETFRRYWDEVREEDWILGENPNWEGGRLVDPRSEAWRDLVIHRVAERLIARGYDGFMLDTLDTVTALLLEDPLAYEGCAAAMAELVRGLRAAYPHAVIVVNGGLPLLRGLAPHVDGVMYEGTRYTYDFGAGSCRPRTPSEIEWLDTRLARVKAAGLPVLALEYVHPDDLGDVSAVVAEVRALGYIPFVSEITLRSYPSEGKPR
jgi:uncharacterized protein (TIGR01370 family)